MTYKNSFDERRTVADQGNLIPIEPDPGSVASHPIDADSQLNQLNQQLEDLSGIIKNYNILRFKDQADQLDCICAMMEQLISENIRESLLQFIRCIGYEKIQKAFNSLNQVCEDQFREEEDLFGILKRHRLNYPVPENDSLKIYRISQFLNVTLIHFHLQKKKGFKLTDLQRKIKLESARILEPLLDRIINILKEENFAIK